MPTEKEFKVNEYITLKLEHGKTNIYVNDKRFRQCKFLLLEIPIERMSAFDEIESIDQAAERSDAFLERSTHKLDPETEFWGHCSNLQVWVENNYNTRLLHRNLAFPLLKKLTDCGDPLAKRVFEKEIAKRAESKYPPVILYLLKNKYLNYLNFEQLKILFFDLLTTVEHMPDEWDRICFFYELLTTIKDIKLIENFSPQIEKIFSSLLTEVENMVKIDRIPFSVKLKHIDTNDWENMNKYYKLGTLIAAIKGTDLVRKKLVELLTTIEKILHDQEKAYAFSELFDAIKGTNLMEKYYFQIGTTFSNVLTAFENLPDSKKKVYAFSLLLTTIKGTDLIKKFSSKIEHVISNLLMAENMTDYVKGDALTKLILAIERTDFLEKIITDILKFIFKIDDNYYKQDALANLISAVKGTDSVEKVKKITNTLNILDYFFQFFKLEIFSKWIEGIRGEKFLDENIAEILNTLENLQENSKVQAFSNLIFPIKELKQMDLLRDIENLESESDILSSSNLISRIKRTATMDKDYSLIESKFMDGLHVIEELENEFTGDNISRTSFEALYLISSIVGTSMFRDNYNSIKKIFSDLLRGIKHDAPFYYNEDYMIDYLGLFIKTMQGTKLVEYIPTFLKKLEQIDVLDDHDMGYVTRFMIFDDVIQLAKTNNLMSEYFSQFLHAANILLDDEKSVKDYIQNLDPFYDFISALGKDLIITHFRELLELADNVPPGMGDNYHHSFFSLINDVRDTELMKGSFYDLLRGLDHKYYAFSALLDVIKEPELMRVKISEVFNLLNDFIGDENEYYAYAKLVEKLKAMQLINEYYTQLEKKMFILLDRTGTYGFPKLIESISGTNLLNKNFDSIFKCIENLGYIDQKNNAFSKIIKDMELELLMKKFPYIFDTINKSSSDSLKVEAISDLIEEHGSYLIKHKFLELLEAIDTLSGDNFRFNLILELIYLFDGKDFQEKLPILKKRYPTFTAYRDEDLP
ncbi:MAG: hypothetical protein ACXAB8_17360 [Promethearchaeota archaeon]